MKPTGTGARRGAGRRDHHNREGLVMSSGVGRAMAAALVVAAAAVAAPAGAQESGEALPRVTLGAAVRQALAENRELEAARYELAGARGAVREAWSNVFPTVNLVSNYTRNLEVPVSFLPARLMDPNAPEDQLVPVRFGTDNVWYGQLRLEQPVFQAAAFIGVGAAARYRALTEEAVRGATHQVVTRTRLSFLDVLVAEESARLQLESVRRVREALEQSRAMFRAGLASEYDVLRMEVELANLEPGLRRSDDALAAARRTLAVQLGYRADEPVSAAGSLSEVDLSRPEGGSAGTRELVAFAGVDHAAVQDEDALVDAALRNRSDLRQVRLTRDLHVAQLRAEQSEYLPRLAFFGTWNRTVQEGGAPNFFGRGDPLSAGATGQQVGLQFSMPLFSGLARPARVDQRRAELRQVEVQERQATEQVRNQVRTLAARVREARERAEAQLRATGQARRGYEIARVQFREGLGSRLELTDAEVALRASEFNYAQAVYDYLVARAQLDEAVGMVPGVER
jgi:outer membrane protein